MRQYRVVVPFAVLAVLVLNVPPAAAASPVGLCNETGIHRAEGAGATMTPRHLTWRVDTNLGPCQLPDGSIESGTMVSKEIGMFICGLGIPGTLAPVPFTIEWSNGQRSVGTLNPYNPATAPLAVTTGTVDSGEFAGARVIEFHTHYVTDPTALAACASPGGFTRVEHRGTISFLGG
jgi:hypothetical protein